MMKKIIVFMSLFFVSLPLMANCSLDTETNARVRFTKVLSDPTLPAGSVLGVRTIGGEVASAPTFSGKCGVDDLYAIIAYPSVVIAPGVTGVKGGPVYETGIPGIGFEFSKLTEGQVGNPVPATLETVSAYGLTYSRVSQMTVWLIKTRDNIDTNFSSNKEIQIHFLAGPSEDISKVPSAPVRSRVFRLIIDIGPLTYRASSCDITPRGGGTVNLQPINLTVLSGMAQGAATSKQKEFTLDITCPDSSVGLKYIYWFNAITDVLPAKNGVLLNSINELSGGAKDVGFIIKQGTNPIKFFDYATYKINSVSSNQSLSFTADYYKVTNDISTGAVRAMMEVIIQEE